MRPAIWLAVAIGFGICGVDAGMQTQPRVVRITAERFSFTPSEVVADPGEEIELRIKSDDTAHGFRIAGTSVNVVVPKRGKGEVTVTFRAPDPGRYTFECTRMCGAGHNFMRGELVVRGPKTSRP